MDPTVGGTSVPVDKLAILAPYMGLVILVVVVTTITAIYVRRARRRKDK